MKIFEEVVHYVPITGRHENCDGGRFEIDGRKAKYNDPEAIDPVSIHIYVDSYCTPKSLREMGNALLALAEWADEELAEGEKS